MIQVVTRERHAGKHWKRPDSFAFARKWAIVPVVIAELQQAVLSFPLAFVRQQEQFELMAILGVVSEQNLFVGGDGRWLGNYVPAYIRSYPFRLVRAEGDKLLLCVDEEGARVGDEKEGELFFDDEEGGPSEAIRNVLAFLQQLKAAEVRTRDACNVLAKKEVLKPWPLSVKRPQGEQTISGLFQADEAVLHGLDKESIVELRDTGALAVAYGQIFSMGNLHVLGRLLKGRQEVKKPPITLSGEVDLSFFK